MVPAERSGRRAGTHSAGADVMPTTLKTAAESYLRAKALSRATRNEYLSTLRKWEKWGGGIPVEQLRRKDLREFLLPFRHGRPSPRYAPPWSGAWPWEWLRGRYSTRPESPRVREG